MMLSNLQICNQFVSIRGNAQLVNRYCPVFLRSNSAQQFRGQYTKLVEAGLGPGRLELW